MGDEVVGDAAQGANAGLTQKPWLILQHSVQNAERIGPHAMRNVKPGQPQTGRIASYAAGPQDMLKKLLFDFEKITYRAMSPRRKIEKFFISRVRLASDHRAGVGRDCLSRPAL